jgi:homoserine kinase
MKAIKVFSPATLSNIGPGYDIFGLALEHIGDTIELSWRSDAAIVIAPVNGFPDLPLDPKNNIAGIVAALMLVDQGLQKGLDISIEKNVMPGSGLGSSGSSAAGTAFALNALLGSPYSKLEVVNFAMQGEAALAGKAHADNVAPAVMGGFTLVKGYDPLNVYNIPFPEEMYIAIVHPQVEVKTSEARKLLPTTISLETHTQQGGNIAGMVAGMTVKNYEWIKESMGDFIAEPNRAPLIPAYAEAKSLALEHGAIGCSISGSGPSIFAFTKNKATATKITDVWQLLYEQQGIISKTYTSKINGEGCKILTSK